MLSPPVLRAGLVPQDKKDVKLLESEGWFPAKMMKGLEGKVSHTAAGVPWFVLPRAEELRGGSWQPAEPHRWRGFSAALW